MCNSWYLMCCNSKKSKAFLTSTTQYTRFELNTQTHIASPAYRLPQPRPPISPATPALVQGTKWKKGKLLGIGTLGHIYAGFNSDIGKMCTIQEVGMTYNEPISIHLLKLLQQSIQVLSHLSHPNILQYYESHIVEGKLSICVESATGGSVLKLLREYGAFSESVVKRYTSKILSGLVYLHQRNIAHGGLKGDNIFITPQGEVKLADFGIAKHIESCSSLFLIQGSAYWTAPEVINNKATYSFSGDIWSLGCVILEMITSKPPYEAAEAISGVANEKEITELPDELSEEAKDFIRLCLQRNPYSRPTATKLMHHPFIREAE